MNAYQDNYGGDVAFMKRHTAILELVAPDNPDAKIAVAPGYQARIMTSTATGDNGPGFGWINREVIADGSRRPQINVFGGEDRYWLGPEGGQFSIYFDPGAKFDLSLWRVPDPIDWSQWDATISQTTSEAAFEKTFELTNWSGTTLKMTAERIIRVMSAATIKENLDIDCDGLNAIGYETENILINRGASRWSQETGLLSIWILGMFKPSPATTVILPFKTGSDEQLGPIVNDAYFGKVPADRLKADANKGVIYFSGDGKYRSKIGLSPMRAKNVLGSYDAENRSLTIVQYSQPESCVEYVNAMWEYQEKPFEGDVVNAYNDGPAKPGAKQLGPFYELESSSPALAPAPGEKKIHTHRTFHFSGKEEELDAITRKLLGVSIQKIKNAL